MIHRHEAEALAEKFVRACKDNKPNEAIECAVVLFVEFMDKLERIASALEINSQR